MKNIIQIPLFKLYKAAYICKPLLIKNIKYNKRWQR